MRRIVAIDAGKLPAASRVTMRQWIFPRALCAVTPAIFVSDAKIKSVPTAMSTGTLKRKTNAGVMSDPPPTPVSPTIKPTIKPTTGYNDSNGKESREEVGANRHQLGEQEGIDDAFRHRRCLRPEDHRQPALPREE